MDVTFKNRVWPSKFSVLHSTQRSIIVFCLSRTISCTKNRAARMHLDENEHRRKCTTMQDLLKCALEQRCFSGVS